MLEFSTACIRCGTPLKKQIIGSNEFYYCKKCGSISSAASVSVPSQYADQGIIDVKNESASGQ
jgi:hypothetical protein